MFLKYIGLRLSFDREVFAWFSQLGPEQLEAETEQLDASLNKLKLISINSTQSWDERCQSSIRLIRTQFILCCVQIILLLLICSLVYM